MKQTLITAAIALLVGFGLGSQLSPTVKTKEVEVEKQVVVKDVITVTKIITRPDGSKEEVITTTDKSKENKQSTNTKTVAKSDWHASISANTPDIGLNNVRYTIQVERRILGDLFIGGNLSSDKSAGLSVGLEF